MHNADTPALEGEILGEEIPDPEAREATPGWVTRNRGHILRGRALAQALMVAAPPPARLALAAAAVAAEGLVLAADTRRGAMDAKAALRRAGILALESTAILAATRFAPSVLARHGHRLRAAHAALGRVGPAPVR
jgi:hypothetical protein